ncbi:preprotein translocase subunit YajC [Miniphocaeibacter massiliensis]|uniref:preprotein translocase subunit YajC n=1 Tax=Miniphocaeibacter massiliensis TaxID=2041841 RepID=UPI000C08A20C|nr:preprotein translocase subunit YajC [Miniphocaeibacter massiliensis]
MNAQSLGMFLPLILIIGVMYFFTIRPQQKKQKADMEMRNNLKIGDEIITIGGIKGKVLKVNEDSVIIETSNAKTRMEFVKSAIGMVIRDEPVVEEEDEEEDVEIEEEDDNNENENE